MTAFAVAGFFATPGEILVDGTAATARVYTREILVGHDGKVIKVVGVYEDRLARIDGVWLFAQRAYTVLHSEASA